MEAIQTYKQYKTECAESLKGNLFFANQFTSYPTTAY